MEYFRVEVAAPPYLPFVVFPRYIVAVDYFDAYEKAINRFEQEVVAVMKASDFYNRVVNRGKYENSNR